ncbi:hypothetical protein [Natranaerofaba carboxydovora]|uniref:hypothetical protein n=1 Tax=Natranaerofaba carboxydovora TaxID=2742683 RepID=UPI001F1329BA|nr:hypothetical protein [Natranaerofaba carboxydovora]UMZ74806.1 hypothetical protein ACONDI_02409 [Natranaerofaba carboxydovora]
MKFNKRGGLMLVIVLALSLVVAAAGCEKEEVADIPEDDSLEGTYVGYSWQGEADGAELDEAERYIETILELDEDGIIQNAKMRYFQMYDGYWGTRNDDAADIWVDFEEEPTFADTEGEDLEEGNSMFKISTNNMMSLWAVEVDEDTGQTAAVIVDPWTRFQFEMKFDEDYDFENTTIGEGLTVGNEDQFIPTKRTGGSDMPDWDELADNTIFDIDNWNHVVNDYGTFEGMDNDTTVKEFLEAMGVEFENNTPVPMGVEYGYHSLGGWSGNYDAITEYLEGQDATELTSLVDWEVDRWGDAVNEDNVFGVDVPSGATNTAQDSIDTITGATVRMSRESTSYQRALVNTGILAEDEVVIGRF